MPSGMRVASHEAIATSVKDISPPPALYIPSEKVTASGFMMNGMKNGPWTYFQDDGKTKKAEGQFTMDSRTGTWKFYWDTGELSHTGEYVNKLMRVNRELKIHERRAILDAEELGAMGSVSFIL